MKLTYIIFLFFIFCVIAIGEMEDKEYKDFDLYTESSFLKWEEISSHKVIFKSKEGIERYFK